MSKRAFFPLFVPTVSLALLSLAFFGCSTPQPGPDKTIAGALLGAGWGAGAGAIIANNSGSGTGEGAAVGSGFGLVSGAMAGYAYDDTERTQLRHDRELESLRIQNAANGAQLAGLQTQLDRAATEGVAGGVFQVFFDPDETSLKAGAIANLEAIANSVKVNPRAFRVQIIGHSDDAGTPDYNLRLSEARARAVSSYLASSGIALDRLQVANYGSTRPIATNNTPVGRQLNRRVDIYISR